MESKITFGDFIRQRRKELGMTQREFADRLFVTDSAVSKWERGMSYPDITLLRDICDILEVTEHELLTASEDVEARTAEKLAKRYMRMARAYRWGQIILYGLLAVICLLCDLVGGDGFGWSVVVLASELVAASLTLTPALVPERQGGLYTAVAFPLTLVLLLGVCCLYSGGSWFPMAAVSTLFGLGLVLLPYILRRLPLPQTLAQRKGVVYLAIETVLLLAMFGIGCVQSGGDWFLVAAAATLFGVGLVFLPYILRNLPLPQSLAQRRGFVYLTVETALLLLLLGCGCLWSGGDWFLTAAAGTLFGVGLVLLPVVMRQAPLPQALTRHKAVVWIALETVLLLLLEAAAAGSAASFVSALLMTLPCLVLPWLLVLVIRYLPANGWLKAASCLEGTALWIWLARWCLEKLGTWRFGLPNSGYSLRLYIDFGNWADPHTAASNSFTLVLLGLTALALVCAVTGIVWGRRKKAADRGV